MAMKRYESLMDMFSIEFLTVFLDSRLVILPQCGGLIAAYYMHFQAKSYAWMVFLLI